MLISWFLSSLLNNVYNIFNQTMYLSYIMCRKPKIRTNAHIAYFFCKNKIINILPNGHISNFRAPPLVPSSDRALKSRYYFALLSHFSTASGFPSHPSLAHFLTEGGVSGRVRAIRMEHRKFPPFIRRPWNQKRCEMHARALILNVSYFKTLPQISCVILNIY